MHAAEMLFLRYETAGYLRVDGVSRRLGDAAVLNPAYRESFPSVLPWMLELFGTTAQVVARLPGVSKESLPSV